MFAPMFRHDRPQAGRYREFHQFNCEVIGERDPIIDAEIMVVAYNFLRDLGLDIRLDVNSMGNPEDRARYVEELLGSLRAKRSYLCEDCKRRMVRNPLRVLDCKEERCAPVIEDAPQIIDWLSEHSKNYFMKVLEYLDELAVPYMLRSTLVRGLDYYTDTVFELYAEEAPVVASAPEGEGVAPLPAQLALGGGGRYDGLLEQLGGNPTSACGFGIGLERVASLLRAQEAGGETLDPDRPKVFIAQLGEQARRRALRLIEDLRRAGIIVRHQLGKPSLKAQMELANKFGATHTVIIGQKEVQDGTVIVRDMESGIQETIDQKKLKSEVERIMKI
jgi:histidyl-tRNA synthetase